jgi:hypothetical protein
MNRTTLRQMGTRNLAQRVADARGAMAQQTIDRETAIRRDGIAHPRSIRASRRLSRTESAYRDLLTTYRVRASEDAHNSRRAGRGT